MSDSKKEEQKQEQSPVAAGKVRVMILAHVGAHKPGQVADVTEQEAKYMCEVRKRNDGHGLIEYQVAMKVEDWEAIQKAPKSATGLTQGEMSELGLKNVVETPKDPKFEAHLARIAEGNKKKEAEKAKETSAARKKVNAKKQALGEEQAEQTA